VVPWLPDRSVYSSRSGIATYDIAIFAALGWERRAVAGALADVTPAGPGCWEARLGDGRRCLLTETGMGAARAGSAAAAVPAASCFMTAGCAGGLVPWLRAGDVVAADSVVPFDAAGRPGGVLPAEAEGLAAWAAVRGFRVQVGPLAVTQDISWTLAAKTAAAATGALAVDMESAAVAAAARARSIPFVGLRVVLDELDDDLGFIADVVDAATGEPRVGRALAMVAPRPWLWRRVIRLARRRRMAERRLGAFLAALLGPERPAHGIEAPAATALS
jgi:adenosylhomocysteine nucleosidase